jgi:hypothetical protein
VRLTKAEREQVRRKYDGHCAYCGEPLPERWHADHFEPVIRELRVVTTPRGTHRLASGKPTRPDRDVLANNMPSCPPCNISKGSMALEAWRSWLAGHVNSLNLYHPIYRMARKYGLVQETGAAVTFYFERVEKGA